MLRTRLLILLAAGSLSVSVGAPASAALGSVKQPQATSAKKKHRHCDPNYSGRCLRPNVSDYDCAGGSGNGPYYVTGPFKVVGNDHYRLDADHDGTACE